MLRHLYSVLLYSIAPLVVMRLAVRGLRSPAYREGWAERFGGGASLAPRETLWVHAVSVGEVQAALPLLHALRERYPQFRLLVTTTTPTGAERVRAALGEDQAVIHRYAPYDLPAVVRRFLAHTRPSGLIIMETELWPNLIHYSRRQGAPVILANARLSERSMRGYAKVAPLARAMLHNLSAVAAQSQADAARLTALGLPAERITVTGNIKFDVRMPASLKERAAALRRLWGVNRPVWIAASTHEGEEEMVLGAFRTVIESLPDALLVLVPRHPERFAKVAALCRRQAFTTVLRSEQGAYDRRAQVYLGDSMGELNLFYAASDVAFVGGSLLPVGGHNLLEPAALALPVVVGAHVFNFQEVCRLLLEAGAAHQVADIAQLASTVTALLHDANLRHTVGERGRQVVEHNRGALTRLLAVVAKHIGAATPGTHGGD